MQEGRVIPLLFEIEFKDISGPLAQFQAKKFDSKGVWDVICAINRLGEAAVPDGRLKQLFDALWPDLERIVEAIPTNVKTAKSSRPQHEVLEELVSSVRGLDSRLREMSDSPPEFRSRRTRANRAMQREVMSMLDISPDNPLRLLMLASTVREEVPWLYEIVSEIYRLDGTGNRARAAHVRHDLMNALHQVPMMRLVEDSGSFDIFREIDYLLSRSDLAPRRPTRPQVPSSDDQENKEGKKPELN